MATVILPEPATQVALNVDNLAVDLDGAQVLAHQYVYDNIGDNWDRLRGVGGAMAVDTELAAAIALADGMANPTVPQVGAHLMGWNSADWDRLVSSIANGLEVDVTRVQGAINTELPAALVADDDMANPTAPFVLAALAGYDVVSGNWQRLHLLDASTALTGAPLGHLVVGKTEGKVTYRTAFKGLAGLQGLAVQLRGNAATVVRVTKVQIAKPSVAQVPLRVVKTNTAAHGGTFTSPIGIPFDSVDAAAASGLRLYTAIPANGDVAIGHVWQVDDDGGPGFVDETTDANDVGDADWTIFTAAEDVADYVAIGYSEQFGGVVFDNTNGTAGTNGVVVWEYWDGDSWEVLTNVTDGTTGFTAGVSDGQTLTFDIPTDWAAQVINGSASLFYIRARITTVFTVDPVYDQGFILPAGAEVGTGSVYESDIDTNDVLFETFGDEQNTQALVLRGIAETLEIELSADAALDGYIEWTEE